MSAIVPPGGTPSPSHASKPGAYLGLGILAGACVVTTTSPALAQPAISASVMTDYRFRAYSLSQGQPVAALDLSYDDRSGVYLGASASAVLTKSEGVQFLGLQENIGYARRVRPGLTLDVGVNNANFTRHAFAIKSYGYTEFYVGLLGKRVSSHVFFSPNFIDDDVTSFYAELDGVIRAADHWRANWHIGAHVVSSGQHVYFESGTQFDWRISITREFDSTEAQVALSRGGALPFPREDRRYGETTVVVSITQAF